MGNDTQYVQMDIKIVRYVRDLYIASVLCNRAHVKKKVYRKCNIGPLGAIMRHWEDWGVICRERERENINKMNECFFIKKSVLLRVFLLYDLLCTITYIYFFCRYNLRRISHTLTLTEIEFFLYNFSIFISHKISIKIFDNMLNCVGTKNN